MRTERFAGKIGRTLAESEPWFEEPPHPGESAPNIVVMLLDDTGFAQMGCFGSEIDTPNIDALAAGGLQFTNFHVTPLCSPTRAGLLTGKIAARIGDRILDGSMPPGARIGEQELADEFDVSRGPVRDALASSVKTWLAAVYRAVL